MEQNVKFTKANEFLACLQESCALFEHFLLYVVWKLTPWALRNKKIGGYVVLTSPNYYPVLKKIFMLKKPQCLVSI